MAENKVLIYLSLIFFSIVRINCYERIKIEEDAPYTEISFSKSSNELGFKLGREISRESSENKNIIFAPFNIFTSLAMLQLGADRNTRAELFSVMQWAGNSQQLERMETLNEYLTSQRSRATISVANKMWVAEKIGISSKYRREISTYFDTDIEKTLFGRDTESTRKQINRWVTDKTDGEIKKLFPYESITSDSVLIIANTISFKGRWSKPFDSEHTRDDVFHLENGRQIEIPFMFQNNNFRHGTDKTRDVQLIELPYERNVFSMIVAIPNDLSAMNNVIQSMTQNCLNEWIGILNLGSQTQYHSKIEVFLPKFEISQRLNLGNYLRLMGIHDLFTPGQADLSRMSEQRVHVTDAIHQSAVSVDEKGTRASGGTGIGIAKTSVSEQIRVNRPFLFFIIHKSRSNTILFYGKVMNPLEAS